MLSAKQKMTCNRAEYTNIIISKTGETSRPRKLVSNLSKLFVYLKSWFLFTNQSTCLTSTGNVSFSDHICFGIGTTSDLSTPSSGVNSGAAYEDSVL